MIASVEGIIFDMDGVLCASEPFICEAAMTMLKETYGVIVQKDDFIPFIGAGEDRFIGGVADKYGVKLTMPRDKVRTYEIYLRIIKGRLKPLPGAVEFITACRKRGLKLAVATSADAVKMRGNLAEMKIPLDTFDAIVTGDDVQQKKPDPAIFLLAASRLSVAPAKCIVVEDAINGIRAGKAAGSRCLGITTNFESADLLENGANWTAVDLAHLPTGIL